MAGRLHYWVDSRSSPVPYEKTAIELNLPSATEFRSRKDAEELPTGPLIQSLPVSSPITWKIELLGNLPGWLFWRPFRSVRELNRRLARCGKRFLDEQKAGETACPTALPHEVASPGGAGAFACQAFFRTQAPTIYAAIPSSGKTGGIGQECLYY